VQKRSMLRRGTISFWGDWDPILVKIKCQVGTCGESVEKGGGGGGVGKGGINCALPAIGFTYLGDKNWGTSSFIKEESLYTKF